MEKLRFNDPRVVRYNEALQDYKAECRLFQQIRKRITPPEQMRSQEMRIAYLLAKERFSGAAKKYYEEQRIFRASLEPPKEPSRDGDILAGLFRKVVGIEPVRTKEFQQAIREESFSSEPEVARLIEQLKNGRTLREINSLAPKEQEQELMTYETTDDIGFMPEEEKE